MNLHVNDLFKTSSHLNRHALSWVLHGPLDFVDAVDEARPGMFLAACVEDENVPVIQAKELTPGGVPVPLGHREREGEGERGGERERAAYQIIRKRRSIRTETGVFRTDVQLNITSVRADIRTWSVCILCIHTPPNEPNEPSNKKMCLNSPYIPDLVLCVDEPGPHRSRTTRGER